jgi:TRAP-type C4-dicarboxylate transport system permease small subunit
MKDTRSSIRLVSKLVDRLSSIGGSIAAIAVVVATLLIAVEVIARKLFNWSTLLADEAGGYLLAVTVFMALAYTKKKGGHVNVDIFTNRLSPKTQRLLDLYTLVLSLVASIILAWLAWRLVTESYVLAATAPTVLALPLFIPQLFMSIGISILVMQLAIDLLNQLIRRNLSNNSNIS